MRKASGSDRLRPYDLGTVTELAPPVQVWPCRECAGWHVELYVRGDGELALQEWHEATCKHLLALERDDRADDDIDAALS